jgi:hypothetical protein
MDNVIGKMTWEACKSCGRDDCIKPIGNFSITPKMTWEACKSCGRDDCIKPIGNFSITPHEVICKNHSMYVFAVVGTINMKPVCKMCKIYDTFFKKCGLDTMSECGAVKYLISNTDVKCLSFEAK